jgi:hypothetical protein
VEEAHRIRVTERALDALRGEGWDLEGAAIDYDLEKETEGFLLDHQDAALAAFC